MLRGRLVCLVGLAAGALLPRAAAAEEPPPPIEVGLSPHAGMTFGDMCTQDGDVVGCSNGELFAGVQVAPRGRLSHVLSIGAVASVAAGSGAGDGESQTLWRAAGEVRVHPFEATSPDLAFGVDAGIVAAFDHGKQEHSVSHTKPALGALLALDFPIARTLSLGAELRLFSWFFGANTNAQESGLAIYGTQIGLSLGVTGTIRFGD